MSGGESGSMYPPPSPAGSGRTAHKSRGGDMWGAAAESWSSGSRRTPGQGRAGGEQQLRSSCCHLNPDLWQVTTPPLSTTTGGPQEAAPRGEEGGGRRARAPTGHLPPGTGGRQETGERRGDTSVTPRPCTTSEPRRKMIVVMWNVAV